MLHSSFDHAIHQSPLVLNSVTKDYDVMLAQYRLRRRGETRGVWEGPLILRPWELLDIFITQYEIFLERACLGSSRAVLHVNFLGFGFFGSGCSRFWLGKNCPQTDPYKIGLVGFMLFGFWVKCKMKKKVFTKYHIPLNKYHKN